jgi:hypothetical protein
MTACKIRLVEFVCAFDKVCFAIRLAHGLQLGGVLELWRPPMTIMASDAAESACASVCLSRVALHIVSKTTAFVHSKFMIFTQFRHSLMLKVVWATTRSFFSVYSE